MPLSRLAGVRASAVERAAEDDHRDRAPDIVEDPHWLHYAVERWPPGPEVYVAAPLAIVNQQFRQGGEHKYSYDADTLIAVLTDAGFTAASIREPNAWDSPGRVEGSLLVQAVRP